MGSVGLSKQTPEALRERARSCNIAALLIANTLALIRELDEQDDTLPALKLAMDKERVRLLERRDSLNRRRLGMLAD